MTDLTFRDDMTVRLVKHSASDADVVLAARVSTQGPESQSEVWGLGPAEHGLIRYLMRERHGSPFEHATMTFYVEAPIFVIREWQRHRMASYNEESARYRELEPVFYLPAEGRNLVQVGKPGRYTFESGSALQRETVRNATREACDFAWQSYRTMLAAGVAREVARAALPVNVYSSMYVTMNARSLMNFLGLRTGVDSARFRSHPQREIEMCAELVEGIFQTLMPVTYEAFNAGGRVAP
ncbi:FAD-dependent thymidylate synthase [Streptomyces sp. NPDC001822]|uniref:FAD-dependent thymidylate synthase n=1 Tax=Streptomyces sp. NPDC001822 TaxID=3364614 RepID=UPI0036CE56B7